MEKAREFQKNIYFCYIDYAKTFDHVDHSILWKVLQEMEIPDHLNCLLTHLHAGQGVTELDMKQRTGSKLGKEYIKAVYCHPAYLTFICRVHHENSGLEEAQAGIKIAGRSINNLRYIDDTTLMAESKEELKIKVGKQWQ